MRRFKTDPSWEMIILFPLMIVFPVGLCTLRPPVKNPAGETLGLFLRDWLKRPSAERGVRALTTILPPKYRSSPLWSAGAFATLHQSSNVAIGVGNELPRNHSSPTSLPFRYETLVYVPLEEFKDTVSRLRNLPYWDALSLVYIVLPGSVPQSIIHRLLTFCIAFADVLSPLIIVPDEKGQLSIYNYYLVLNDKGFPTIKEHTISSPDQYNCYFCGIQNFQGYPINITMFKTIPDAVPVNDTNGKETYIGCDGLMMQTIVKRLNARHIIIHPKDGQTYGIRLENGTYTGSVGDLAYRRADVGFNARYQKPQWEEDIEFTYPYTPGNLVVVVPKASQVPLFLHLFLPFQLLTWLIALVMIPVAAFVWWCVWNCEITVLNGTGNVKRSSLCLVFFLTAASFLSVNVKTPKNRASRFFFSYWTVYSLIITSTFQGSLVSYLAIPKFLPDIETLEELDLSGCTILVYPSVLNIISQHNADNSILSKLRNKFIVHDDIYTLIDEVLRRQGTSAIMDEPSAKYSVRERKYATDDDQPRLHIVAERPIHGFFSYALPRFSPFLPRINALVAAITEAGLYQKWRHDTIRTAELEGRLVPSRVASPPPPSPLRPPHLQTAFYLLLLGLGAATVMFLVENCKNKRRFEGRGRAVRQRSVKKNSNSSMPPLYPFLN